MTRPVLWTDEQISAAAQPIAPRRSPSAVCRLIRAVWSRAIFLLHCRSGRDGHDFVEAAFAAGATAALVCRGKIDPKKAAGPLVEVDDVPEALEALARAARRAAAPILPLLQEVLAKQVSKRRSAGAFKVGRNFCFGKILQ